MSASGPTIVLVERLEMSQATALHTQLLDALKTKAPLVVDASAVQVVDSASAQVLVAFALSAKEARLEVRWQRSPAFDDFFERTALASAIT
ncbi:MAG: STAS domain-containing protein [Archangium sp.]|nr:STAS domain-containing protein [Archangium sp.]